MPIHREPADLAAVVREAAEIVRGWAEARQLRLAVDVPAALPMLRLDRTRIRQVMLNLLSNATRFTERGYIRTRVRLNGHEVVVEVQDSGPGIPRENLSRAFETFESLGSDRAREGSGLGLAISRKFIELHGGRMWIESEVGQGTTVGFAIPLPEGNRDAAVPALVRRPMTGAGHEQPVVAVLNADSRAVSLLQRYVEGFRFVQVENAASLPQLAGEAGASAVLYDECDGLEPGGRPVATEALPADIILVECPLPSVRRWGAALGAAGVLTKPVTRDAVLAAIAQLPAPPKSVLIVDDDPDVVRLLGRILKSDLTSCQVFEAYDGGEALLVARSRRPDLILLDLLMPGLTGYQVLREIGSAPELRGTSVVLVSAHALDRETATLTGEVRVNRRSGFTLTEVVQLVGAALSAVTQAGPASPTIGPAPPETRTG